MVVTHNPQAVFMHITYPPYISNTVTSLTVTRNLPITLLVYMHESVSERVSKQERQRLYAKVLKAP